MKEAIATRARVSLAFLWQCLACFLTVLAILPSWSSGADAQPSVIPVDTVSIPAGSAVLEVHDVMMRPVWCDADTVAFQRSAITPTGPRQWMEYHSLAEKTVRVEALPPTEGRLLIACGPGGNVRVMMEVLSSDTLKRTYLVIPSTGQEIELVRKAKLISADRSLHHFIFEVDPEPIGSPPYEPFVLVTLANTNGSGRKLERTDIPSPGRSPIRAAAIKADGSVVAYALEQFTTLRGQTPPAPVDLYTFNTQQAQPVPAARRAFVDDNLSLHRLLFENDELILSGNSDNDELVIASCTVSDKMPFRCTWRELNVDSKPFESIGIDRHGSVIVASRDWRLGGDGYRACIFVYSEPLAHGVPAECRAPPPASRPASEMGISDTKWFHALSPDRRFVSVLRTHQPRAGGPPPSWPTWAVVPVSAFQITPVRRDR